MPETMTYDDIERVIHGTEKRCGDKCTDAHKEQGSGVADKIIESLVMFIGTRPVTDIAFATNMVDNVITVMVLNKETEYVTITIPTTDVWCFTHCAGQVALWANRRGYEFTPMAISGRDNMANSEFVRQRNAEAAKHQVPAGDRKALEAYKATHPWADITGPYQSSEEIVKPPIVGRVVHGESVVKVTDPDE